uniref:Uncharacterized protein n=1 Tax=Opuntia streptacantha TaxID=393608 RepID=A0A7C8YXK7_OPUST
MHSSSNTTQFGNSSIKGHLPTFKTLHNTRTRPRLLTPHTKPTTTTLTSGMTSPLSLSLLPRTRLRPEVVEPESEPRSWLGGWSHICRSSLTHDSKRGSQSEHCPQMEL